MKKKIIVLGSGPIRIGQGIGLGGEWGGAALVATENAPPGKRGWFGSFPQLGAPIGLFAANGVFFIIPAHPVHMINLASRLGVSPAQGHTGFDRVVLGEEANFEASYYAHYLHHKYFEVNYGDGLIPLDKWFGTFHDGSKEGEERMNARYAAKKARLNG